MEESAGANPKFAPCPRCGALVSAEDAAAHASGHDGEDQDKSTR